MPEMENARNLPIPLPGTAPDTEAPEWKRQLDRLEEKADRNARLLHICIGLLAGLLAVLCIGFGVLFYHGSTAYRSLLRACTQVEELAGTVQDSLAALDTDELNRLLQSLPEIADRLNALDVEALNDAIRQVPELLTSVQELERQTGQITGWFNGLGGLFR